MLLFSANMLFIDVFTKSFFPLWAKVTKDLGTPLPPLFRLIVAPRCNLSLYFSSAFRVYTTASLITICPYGSCSYTPWRQRVKRQETGGQRGAEKSISTKDGSPYWRYSIFTQKHKYIHFTQRLPIQPRFLPFSTQRPSLPLLTEEPLRYRLPTKLKIRQCTTT